MRQTIAVVTLTESRVLCRITAVVVERRTPKESCVRHHARRYSAHFRRVAAKRAASLRSHAQITGINELDVFGGFLQPQDVRSFGKVRAILENRVPWLNVRLFLGRVVRGRMWRRSWRNGDRSISAVAIDAAEMDRLRRMHRRFVRRSMARDAARGFSTRLFLRLAPEGSRFLTHSLRRLRTCEHGGEKR